MSLDIGEAFGEGLSRTFSRNGLLLAGVFAAVALLTVVLIHTVTVASYEALYAFFESLSAAELEMSEREYQEMLTELETAGDQVRSSSPLAVAGVPASVAGAGLFVTALLYEAVAIVAIRVFATEETDAIPRGLVTDNLVLATINGFVGGIVVWMLIFLGSLVLLLPGVFLAVVFYFLRQEIALKDKNFVTAMADSWRVTKGNRIEVFLVGLALLAVGLVEPVVGGVAGVASVTVAQVVSAVVGGVLTAFGAAVVTRAYVQLDDEPAETIDEIEEDPYAKALGPDDLPR